MASAINGNLNRRPAFLETPTFDEVGSPYVALNALTKLLAWNVQERACMRVAHALCVASSRSARIKAVTTSFVETFIVDIKWMHARPTIFKSNCDCFGSDRAVAAIYG